MSSLKIYDLFVVGGKKFFHGESVADALGYYRLKAEQLYGDKRGHCDHCDDAERVNEYFIGLQRKANAYRKRKNKTRSERTTRHAAESNAIAVYTGGTKNASPSDNKYPGTR